MALENKLTKTQNELVGKEVDRYYVQKAHVHDQLQMEAEKLAKARQKQELKQALEAQMNEKRGSLGSHPQAHLKTSKNPEKRVVVNWDLRPELASREEARAIDSQRAKIADFEMVQALDK
jgi:hypothetical protein